MEFPIIYRNLRSGLSNFHLHTLFSTWFFLPSVPRCNWNSLRFHPGNCYHRRAMGFRFGKLRRLELWKNCATFASADVEVGIHFHTWYEITSRQNYKKAATPWKETTLETEFLETDQKAQIKHRGKEYCYVQLRRKAEKATKKTNKKCDSKRICINMQCSVNTLK